jgi:endoribonuclease Dicer
VESILGAIIVSDNFVADGTQTIYGLLLKPFYEKHISLKTLSHHPTKILFELFQSRGCQKFEIVREDDVEEDGFVGTGMRCDGQLTSLTSYVLSITNVEVAVICHDVILASAIDLTPQLASRRASFLALDALEGDTEFLSRTCDCRAMNEASKGSKGSRRRKSTSGADSNQDASKSHGKALNDGNNETHDEASHEVDEDGGDGDELAVEGVLYDDDEDEEDGEEDGEEHSEESVAERE